MFKKFTLIYLFIIASFASLQSVNYPNGKTLCSERDCYSVVEILGVGAFGTVYSVLNSSSQMFAMKTYLPYDHTDINNRDLYSHANREFLIGQILNHLNIIKSLDLFCIEEEKICVDHVILEHIEGATLASTTHKFNSEEKLKIFKQLTHAMRHAVSCDLYHMDLSLDNMMITKEGDLKIIDLASFCTCEEIVKYWLNIPIDSELYTISKESVLSRWVNGYFSYICLDVLRSFDMSYSESLTLRRSICHKFLMTLNDPVEWESYCDQLYQEFFKKSQIDNYL